MKLDYEKFNKYIERIKYDFQVILIFHGPEEIISNCDQILSITKKSIKVGSFDEYVEELPQFGEFITIELIKPDKSLLSRLNDLPEVEVIIEERKDEKFKIYLKEDINAVLIQITELLGANLFNFKRSSATIKDYLEFIGTK